MAYSKPVLNVLPANALAHRSRKLGGAVVEGLDSPLNAGFLHSSLRKVQDSLHFITQTSLPQTGAKSFAMKSIGEQAKEFRDSQGWTYTRMAKEVSRRHGSAVSRQAITQLEDVGDRKPQYLQALALVMGTTTDALLAGTYTAPTTAVPMLAGIKSLSEHAEPQPEYAGKSGAMRRVPIVGTAKMGEDGFYEEISSVTGAGDGHIEIATSDPNAYGLRVRGNSMTPAIRDGWYVLIEPNGRPEVGEYVLLKMRNGQRMVKELLYHRTQSIEIMSVNGEERRTIYLDELEGIQPVAAVVSPSKWMPD
ncbi:LexA repressor [compost metagenome]